MKKAVFPGTFDPITIGHVDIIQRALPLFDEIVIGVGRNNDKTHLFDLETRLNWIREIFKDEPKVSVDHYPGLTVDFARFKKAQCILRGLRSVTDFEYEFQISQVNKGLNPDIETVFLMATPAFTPISSKIVRDVIIKGGNYKPFVPDAVRL
ncbi:MAG TPA: pantetheine-phosphate adenylyltransferase [Bacteroidetes bacterium]|nr:pantetheine-phosphate adenylyltransferase [Bacteroidota bacterium]